MDAGVTGREVQGKETANKVKMEGNEATQEAVASNENEPLDIEILLRVSQKIGKLWKWLGRDLGLNEEMLGAIEESYKSDDVSEIANQMLITWQKQSPKEATVSNLSEGLLNLGVLDIISPANGEKQNSDVKQKSYLTSSSFSKPSTSHQTQPDSRLSHLSHDFEPSGQTNIFQMRDNNAQLFVNYGPGNISVVQPPIQPDPEDMKKRTKINKILASFHGIGGRRAYPVDTSILMQVRQSLGKSWRDLGLDMGFDKTMLDAIETHNSSSGIKEMAYQTMAKWWRREGDEAKVHILAEHLANIRKYDISLQILGKSLKEDEERISEMQTSKCWSSIIGSFISNMFGRRSRKQMLLNKIQTKLKTRYEKVRLKGLPWIKRTRITLEDCYVELSMIPQDDNGVDLQGNIIELNQIFNSSESKEVISRILVEGGPGYGKTTFGYKLGYDYAKKQNYLANFDLVFVLPLRYYSGLLDELLTEDTVTNEEIEELLSIIKQNYAKTLLVLDGFDELPKQHVQSFLPLLRRDIFPDATVIVTSRPGLFTSEISEDASCGISPDVCIAENIFDRRIKIIGIPESLVPLFIEKHLSVLSLEEHRSVLEQLTVMIKKEMLTSSFVQCPLFLLMIICLLTELETKSTKNLQTRTDLYKEILNFVIRRYLSKTGDNINQPADLLSFEYTQRPFYIDLMIQFGQFAFEAVKVNKLSFTSNEILDATTNRDARIMDLGLLTKSMIQKGFKEETFFEPVHKSLLEFAAAYWLWVQFKNGSHDQWERNMCLLRPKTDTAPYSLLFPFLTGLMGNSAPAIFYSLSPHAIEYNNWFGSLAFCLSEIEITQVVFSSLRPFLSHEWKIAWYKINILSFTTSTQHQKFLSLGLRERLIHEIRWFLEDKVLLPSHVTVHNLIFDFRTSVSSLSTIQNSNINCTNLHCMLSSLDSSEHDWQEFLSMLSSPSLRYETIFFHCLSSKSDTLSCLCSALTAGSLRNVKVEFIRCYLTIHDRFEADTLTQLVQSERVSGIFVQLADAPPSFSTASPKHDVFSDGNLLLQEKIDRLVSVVAKSSRLKHFTLFNGKTVKPLVDLTELCCGGGKSWQWIRLRNVVLKFSHEITNHNCSIQHLQVTDTSFPNSMSKLLQSFQITSLFCNYPFLDYVVDPCLFQDYLLEVHVELDATIFHEDFFFCLSHLQSLQIFSLQMTSFSCQSLSLSVEKWLMSTHSWAITLKMLVIRCVEQNLPLSSEIVSCITHSLEDKNTVSPTCSATPPPNKFFFRRLTISTDMTPTFNNLSSGSIEKIVQFCSLVTAIKQPLIDKQFSGLDVVMLAASDFLRCMSIYKPNGLASLFDIFKTEEAFSIKYDKWGMRENDSMWSKQYYKFTPFSYSRYSVSYLGNNTA